jgi:hypothetical protein
MNHAVFDQLQAVPILHPLQGRAAEISAKAPLAASTLGKAVKVVPAPNALPLKASLALSGSAGGAEAPLFNSVPAALGFAFNFNGLSYERPAVYRMATPSKSGSSKGLHGLDGAAQAGMICAKVATLGPLDKNLLMARFCHPSQPCECGVPCCSGRKPNNQWTQAIAYLADYILHTALAGCVSQSLLRKDYVLRYFTRKETKLGIEALAKKHQVARNTVSTHLVRVNKTLKQLESTAERAAEDILQAAGLVG